jgi:hypothetical protein
MSIWCIWSAYVKSGEFSINFDILGDFTKYFVEYPSLNVKKRLSKIKAKQKLTAFDAATFYAKN